MAAFPGHKFWVSVSTTSAPGAVAPRAATDQGGGVKVVKGKGRSGKLFLPSWQSLEEVSKQVAVKGHFVCLPALQGEPSERRPCPHAAGRALPGPSVPCSVPGLRAPEHSAPAPSENTGEASGERHPS